MKKNEKKTDFNQELRLEIEISDTSSELIMRLEKIILDDMTTHKLPIDFNSLENKGEDA